MRAAVCHAHGPPENVVVEETATPQLAARQVRVRIAAASVNFSDVLIVANEYQIKAPVPFVPGSEFAGVVAQVADGVDGVAVGDRVVGTTLSGAFAEQVVAPVSALTKLPPTVDLRLAAVFGVAHRTAYNTLRSVARVQPGEHVVVLGAGGGVGLAAVQMGVLLGATVTAVASSREKLDAAAACGAHNLIDYKAVEFRPALRELVPDGPHVIVDPVGGEHAELALRSLRWGGRFVTVGYASGDIPRIPLNLVLLKGVQILGFEILSFATNEPEEYARNNAELIDHLASGRVVPHIGAAFALDDATAALRYVADRKAIGKIVIDVASI